MPASARRRAEIGRVAALLPLGELLGRFGLVAHGALPAPSAILAQLWQDRALYPPHLLATLGSAAAGFAIGNLAAGAAGGVFVPAPGAERLARGINVALFAVPTIALVPILVVALPGSAPQVALAAISVYFPTMLATVVGLRQVGVTLKNGRESTVRGAERKRGQAASACFGLAVVPRRGRNPSGPT